DARASRRAVRRRGAPATEGEREAGAAIPSRDRGVGLAEGLEEARNAVGRDPDAGVADLDDERPAVAGLALHWQPPAGDRQLDFTGIGELDRVGQQVDDDLAQ